MKPLPPEAFAVKVAEVPLQIVALATVAVTVAVTVGFTVTITELVLKQPAELVAVTEYVVVTVGLTGWLTVVTPLLHR